MMFRNYDAPFNEELKCYVQKVQYDWTDRNGFVFMPENSCTDMTGCVALFERIDPKVSAIVTFSGGNMDTCYYRRGGEGEWQALGANEARRIFAAFQQGGFP